MTVYLDIILLENLCMNFIILYATGFIIKSKIRYINLTLSSLIGAIYAILVYMQIFEIYSNMITKVILSVAMVYIAFLPKNVKGLLKYLLIFYMVSFVFGGCAFALLYFLKPENIFMENGVYIGTYPIKVALLGAIVGFIVVHIAFKIVKSRVSKKAILYDVEITIDTKKVIIKAMLDTGNGLRDPITGSPVAVVEKEKLFGLLPDNILNNTEKIIGGDWENIDNDINYRARFCLIPFSSIGKQNGMLLGFKVDEIRVISDIEETINKKAIICLYNQKLSKADAYSALIGLDMLEGSMENEFVTNIEK